MSQIPAPPTFPPHTHAKLSPRTYLTAHLNSTPSTRPSGRSPTQSRPITSHTNSLTYCHGSAVLRQGDTAVVCGVRGEILKVSDTTEPAASNHEREGDNSRDSTGRQENGDDIQKQKQEQEQEHLARLGVLVPNIDFNPGCSPDFPPGGPPSATAQALSQRLLSALHNCAIVSPESLRIYAKEEDPPPAGRKHEDAMSTSSSSDEEEGGVQLPSTFNATSLSSSPKAEQELKAYWTLYIDVIILSLDHGPRSAFDIAFTAVLNALHATKLPLVQWDAEAEAFLGNPDPEMQKPLVLRQDLPISTSFGVFVSTEDEAKSRGRGPGLADKRQRYVLTDPDALEEDLCEEVLTLTLEGKARVCRVEKSGGGFLDPARIRECIERAMERRVEVLSGLGIEVEHEAVTPQKGNGHAVPDSSIGGSSAKRKKRKDKADH